MLKYYVNIHLNQRVLMLIQKTSPIYFHCKSITWVIPTEGRGLKYEDFNLFSVNGQNL